MSVTEVPMPKRSRSTQVDGSAAPPKPFPTIRSNQLVLKPSDYLLKGLIAPGEFGVWYGASGSGKTFEVIDVAHAIATGRDILGRRVRQAPVLYCSLEGANGFEKRVVAINRERGEAPDLHIYAGALPLHENEDAVRRLIATTKCIGAKLVIVDTLSRSMPGADENSAIDMTRFISTIGKIIQETGAHVLVVHHSGKDDSKGGRGHSSLKAAADIEIEISKSGTGEHIMKLTKIKDGRSDVEYPFTLREVDLGTDDDGDPITTCVVVEGDQRPSGGHAAKITKGDREALKWLREAIEDFGATPPLDLPKGIRATTKDRWQETGKKRSGKSDDAVRKQIDRAITSLTVDRRIAVHAPFFWLLK